MAKKRLPLSENGIAHRLVSYGMQAPAGVESLSIPIMVKILRRGLGMSQAQLAKRAGLAQSHIARIERGTFDPRVSTVRKIFHALCCEAVVIPKFKEKPENIVRQRAMETAQKKVLRMSGSMALEKQLPDKRMLRQLVLSEEKRLENELSSEIWEE